MAGPSPRRRSTPFRPSFTLLILYFGIIFSACCLLLALPDLLQGARALPPGSGELTPQELEEAKRITREALRGRLHLAFVAALLVTALAAYRQWLPGLRPRR